MPDEKETSDATDKITVPAAEVDTTKPSSTNKSRPDRSKKTLLIILVLALAIGAAAAAYFLTKDTSTPTTTSSQPSSQTATTSPSSQKPFAVAYAYRVNDKVSTVKNCGSQKTQAYWRPIGGGDKTSAVEFGTNNYVSFSEIYKNKVIVATDAGCGSTDGSAVWYSQDAGKSYQKILKLNPPKSSGEWDQITSIKISNDGKTVLAAVLPADRAKNTVKEIDLSNNNVKDLFSSEKAGVFIQGYDRAKKNILYNSGCFNCDGNVFSILYEHNLDKNADRVVFEDTKHVGIQTVPSSDFSKLLLLKGVNSESGLGASAPFTLEEFTMANSTSKTLLTLNEEKTPQVGYRDGDDVVYYTKGNAVYGLDSKDGSTALFETTKPIIDVPYVGKDLVLARAGDFNNYTLTSYTNSTKTAVKILDGDEYTSIFGLTWN